MNTLVIETEHLQTGKLNISREHIIGVNSESEKKEYKDTWFKRLSGMHLRSNHKLSRIYWEK